MVINDILVQIPSVKVILGFKSARSTSNIWARFSKITVDVLMLMLGKVEKIGSFNIIKCSWILEHKVIVFAKIPITNFLGYAGILW